MSIKVNGELIEDKLITDEMERMRPQYEQVFADMPEGEREKQLMDWARENLIEQFVLKQLASAKNYDVSEELKKTYNDLIERSGGKEKFYAERELELSEEAKVLEDIELQIKIRRLIEEVQNSAKKPSENEIANFYQDHKRNFIIPEMVRASHIVKHLAPGEENEQAYNELLDMHAKIASGEDTFENLAAQNSDCPENAGDLGYFARGKMVEDFEEVAFEMEKGEVSEVFRTEFGFHIAKVTDKQPERQCGIEEVRDYIEKQIFEQHKEKALEDFLDNNIKKAKIS